MTTTHHTNPSRKSHTGARRPGRRSPVPSGPDVAGELRRLTPRDLWLLDLLGEHQVLTTDQITALAFDHITTARHRLRLLANRDILTRFRAYTRPGSDGMRWTLGWIGAAYIAARDDAPTPRARTITDRTNRLAASPRLAHRLGVNGFFVALIAHARQHPTSSLRLWWSERRCYEICGQLARPDGHGVWTEDERTVSWWLEYDQGTEHAGRVAAKLDGYAALHQATGLTHAVLYRMQTPRQETELQRRLRTHPAVTGGRLLVATTSGDPGLDPAGPVWLPAGHSTRRRLAHLPTVPTMPD